MEGGEAKKNVALTNIEWAIAICILIISFIFIFPPEYLLTKQISRFAIQWMFICLALGIIFMFMDYEKLLFISFSSAGAIASFLLYSYNSSFNLAANSTEESLSIAFVNPSLSTDEIDSTQYKILKLDPDIIILDELSPDWKKLTLELNLKYSNSVVLNRIDPYGKAIFSKYEFIEIDTIDPTINPVLSIQTTLASKKKIQITVANSLPAVTKSDIKKLNIRLLELSTLINSISSPHILSANLNLVPWDKQMRDFKINTKLNSSRRDQSDGSTNTLIWNVLNVPMNEIFYSKELECAVFKEINDYKGNSIGLYGKYQLKKSL